MTYFLDTSIAIAALRDRPPGVRARLAAAVSAGAEVAISTVAVHELWFGVARSAHPNRYAEGLRSFLLGPSVIDFDQDDAVAAGRLRAHLAAAGRTIGPYDVLIAAAAVRRGLTMVTSNVREFARVPDLVVEDWASAP